MVVPVRIIAGLLLVCWTSTLGAEEISWRAAQSTSKRAESGPEAAVPFRLGRPVPLSAGWAAGASESGIRTVSYSESDEAPIVQLQAPPPPPPPPGAGVPAVPPPSVPGAPYNPEEGYNCGVEVAPGAAPVPGAVPAAAAGAGGLFNNIFRPTGGRTLFESDHCFDSFSSPVTNPFLFNDPRALTEVRPIFLYQTTPLANPQYHGGDIEYAGLQASAAITEYFSVRVTKLGWLWNNPNNPDAFVPQGSGFGEVHVAPQWTFWRNDRTRTLAATGLIFQIPTGSSNVIQDTGTLSLVPYISFGQEFLESVYGRFHFLSSTGYAFRVSGERTDYFYSSFHLDFDVIKQNRFFPFVEFNYFRYTRNGTVRPLNYEGRALINFGSTNVSGNNDLSIATGFRYKFVALPMSVGVGGQWPLLNNKDIMDFRLIVDLIFRY